MIAAVGEPLTRKALRVLVVDDNRDAADTLAMLLSLWGYPVRVAYDGDEALLAADQFRPHCLFLDIGLPGVDGYNVARRLRANAAFADAELIALSAYSGKDHAARAREAGFNQYLVKPAEPARLQEILAMLNKLLDVAEETRALVGETKAELRETKKEIREVKAELREVKYEVKELKQALGRQE
jgi:CheY-like chemotaxis protein